MIDEPGPNDPSSSDLESVPGPQIVSDSPEPGPTERRRQEEAAKAEKGFKRIRRIGLLLVTLSTIVFILYAGRCYLEVFRFGLESAGFQTETMILHFGTMMFLQITGIGLLLRRRKEPA
jgi:hypothetical protein